MGGSYRRDSYEGDLADAPSLHRFAYAKQNPTTYRDEHGRSATVVGGVTGFFWGFGQMVGRGIDDLVEGKVRDTSEYLGIWGQNIVAGVELGASVDVCALSGGTAASACGALGMAGFDALTVTGEGKSAGDFAKGQVIEGAKGAVLGPLVAKAAPYVGKAASAVLKQVEKVPGVQFVEKKAVQAVGNVVQAARDRYVVTEADALVASVDEAAGSFFTRSAAPTPVTAVAGSAEAAVPARSVEAAVAPAPTQAAEGSRVGLSRPTQAQLDLHREITLRGYMEKVEQLDVGSAPSAATFWSGPGNRARAEAFARATGRTTLEMTPGGRYLENEALFKRLPADMAIQPWRRLSGRFAGSASGKANLFVNGARPGSVFRTVEEPALEANPDVYGYTYRGY